MNRTYLLNRSLFGLSAICVALLVCACGGGSTSNNAPPPPGGPTAQDLAAAKAATLTSSLDLATHVAKLTWMDTFPTTTGYQIQQQSDTGAWSTIDSIPGHQGSNQALSWQQTVNVSTHFRVQAVLANYDVPIQTSQGAESVQVVVPTTSPTINLDQAEPIAGVVHVSIGGGQSYSSAAYYIDLQSFANSTTGPDYAATLDTGTLTAGSHLILVRLATSGDSSLELRRTVQTTNPEVAIQITPPDIQPVPGNIDLIVGATSDFGIQSVSATLDGQSLGSLSKPNACLHPRQCSPLLGYGFTVDPRKFGSGPHTFAATATDTNGKTASSSIQVTFNNPPAVNLTSPVDGALAYGTLHVAGNFSTDKGGLVTLTATLGNVSVLSTSSSPFATDFSLAGVTPGSYTLTVTATDASGATTTIANTVTVTSSASLVYTPLATLGQNGSILAADPTTLLYQTDDGTIHLLSGTTDTVLRNTSSNTPQAPLRNWQASHGHAFANTLNAVYMWAPDGTSTNLTTVTNDFGALGSVHWPWIVWSSTSQPKYTFYNVDTGVTVQAPAPPARSIGWTDNDFTLSNGQLILYFLAQDGNVYRWRQDTGVTTALTSSGLDCCVQTDGVRAAWEEAPANGWSPSNLVALDIASGAQQTLSTSVSRFSLADGLLAWSEKTSNSAAVKVSDGNTITTLTTRTTSLLFRAGGGHVAYQDDFKLYAWDPGTGAHVVLEASPGQVFLSGNVLYFTNGARQTVYAVTLN